MDSVVEAPDGYIAPYFTWSEFSTSKRISLSNNNLTLSSNDANSFKSSYGSFTFVEGKKYYFEVTIEKGQLIKLGVARPEVTTEEAFCDSNKGWAIYHGELRHSSNSSGGKYGTSLKAKDVLGVQLDMVEGCLTFIHNKVNWGVAFKSDELKKGELVAACSLFCAGDSVSLNMMVLED